MIATPAGRYAAELWVEQHPDTTYVPDPDQLRLRLDAGDDSPETETPPTSGRMQ